MKVTLKTMLATLLAIVTPAFLWSQTKPIPINVSLFNESTAIPFTRFITTPVHPGIQVGTEFDYNRKSHTRLFQTSPISITIISHKASAFIQSWDMNAGHRWVSL